MAYQPINPATEAGRLSPTQQAQLNHFDRLPIELLVNIMSLLDLDSLMKFAQCNKKIYSIICSDLKLRKKILDYIFREDFLLRIGAFIEKSLSLGRFELMDLIISFQRGTLGLAVFDLFARHPHLVECLNSELLTVSQAMRAPSGEYLRLLLPIGEGRSSPMQDHYFEYPLQRFGWIFNIPYVSEWVDMRFIPEYQQPRSLSPVRAHYFEDNYYSGRREFDLQRWSEDSLRHQREREHEQSIPQIREHFLIALREKLITVEQAWAAPSNYQEDSPSYLKTLLTPKGLLALRKKWLTVEQAWAAPSVDHLGFLLGQKELIKWEIEAYSDRSGSHSEECGTSAQVQGLEALSSRLLILTVEQAWEAPTADHLGFLLTEEGLIALRDELITVNDVWNAVIPEGGGYGRNSRRHCLQYLLTPNGLIALRKRLMTVKQALSFGEPTLLKYLLTPNGLTALRDKLITIDEIFLHRINSWQLYHLLTNHGLIALKKGLITVKQTSKARRHERIDIKESLELLLTQGVGLLEKGEITVEQALSMGAEKLNHLLAPKSMNL